MHTRKHQEANPMRIAITGSSGMIGAALAARLEAAGHRVRRLLRTERAEKVGDLGGDAAWWNPDKGYLDAKALEGVDAVVNLAGHPVAGRRWTDAEKARIRDSRVTGTRLLAGRMAEMKHPPSVFVSASAVGYYGSRGDLPLEETETPGTDFLAGVCQDWEAAAAPAVKAGVRVVHPRFAAVLDPGGGMLARLLPPFRLGLGGPIADGTAWLSWITLEDAVGVLTAALLKDRLSGPVNTVAPEPVTNREFTKTLAATLRRPAVLPLPAAAVRLLFGEMGTTLLMASQRCLPAKLTRAGPAFKHPEITGTLRDILSS